MNGENDNRKDIHPNSFEDTSSIAVPYNKTGVKTYPYEKTNKLITALYIVTDIMDKDEPLRLKLRTIGLEILSDKSFISRTILKDKIKSVMSFLDISVSIKIISEMNYSILKREFNLLLDSLGETKAIEEINNNWLEEFLKPKIVLNEGENLRTENIPKIRQNFTNSASNTEMTRKAENSQNIVRKQRREDILEAIKQNGGSATITEVRAKAAGALLNCGEKTLQRELIAMLKEGILAKTGEKRWSKYALK